MGMGQRKIGKNGLFHFNVMLSLDSFFGGNGYPLLFQTGESWQGKLLVDRQHPHVYFRNYQLLTLMHLTKKREYLFIWVTLENLP